MTESPRDRERATLDWCVDLALGDAADADVIADAREAALLLLAEHLMRSRFPAEARRLEDIVRKWRAARPDATLDITDVVERGIVQDLPRFRHMLELLVEHRLSEKNGPETR
jgi:hypothetical protein